MRLAMTLAVARAEIRTIRRSIHYWLFAVASVLIGCYYYTQLAIAHGSMSGIAAGLGTFSPRYYVGLTGVYLYLFFFVGLIFLAFDVRSRDMRNRMDGVLDSRPVSNAEFLSGKMCGLVLMAWLPVLILVLLLQSFGFVSIWMELLIGDPVETRSLIGFLLYSLTALSVWCAFLILMAMVLRNRGLVAMIALAVIGLLYWSSTSLPFYLTTVLSLSPGIDYASDLTPRLFRPEQWIRFLALWMMAGAMLAFAVGFYPRQDGQSAVKLLRTSAGLSVVALTLFGAYYMQQTSVARQQHNWLAAQEAHRDGAKLDLRSITGSLSIDPGNEISMALELTVAAPQPSNTMMFTLNPGLTVLNVAASKETAEISWIHENGLLEITLTEPVAETTLTLEAEGSPNVYFGYLDSSYDQNTARSLNTDEKSDLLVLGYQPSIFDSNYVAMMPGAHWLPSAGTDVPEDDPRSNPYDYYMLDLQVEIPKDWLIAGPGQAKLVNSDSETTRYRFQPDAPVPNVGLFASLFERRVVTTSGIEFQILLHPGHIRNLALFEESEELVLARITELFSAAENLGLPYPYDTLSLVETPTRLRAYGGGWRMDTVQSLPGVLILRENGFPTSRFETALSRPDQFGPVEGGMPQVKLEMLERHFENDFSGGNSFTGAARNFLLNQTSAEGEGALAINFVLNALTAKLLTGKDGYFSAHSFYPFGVNTGGSTLEFLPFEFMNIAKAHRETVTHRPSVWSRAVATSLAELDMNEDPSMALKVLTLKGEAIAETILEGLGREQTAALLSKLVSDHRGGTFTLEDFHRITRELNTDLEPLVGDWLHSAALPGFLASKVTSLRLTDDDSANPRYQSRIHIRNDESVPGSIDVLYHWGDSKDPVRDSTGTFGIPANSSVEVGIVTSTPLLRLIMKPHLALNREPSNLIIPTIDTEEQTNMTPFSGVRPSSWEPQQTLDIIVDDLDSGFSVRTKPVQPPLFEFPFFRTGRSSGEVDHGLPEFSWYMPPPDWNRTNSYYAWGKYRRTLTLVASGSGDQHVAFTTDLPHQGRWRLYYHLWVIQNQQGMPMQRFVLGDYQMTLISDGVRKKVAFDAQAGSKGWNDLGEFELPAGKVSLEVSDATNGNVVFADAIRWQPVDLADGQ